SSFLLLSFSIILPYLIVDLKLCNRTVIQIQGKCNRQEVPKKIKQAVRQWQENLQHALSS
ncbi:hypothetical protein ACK4B0_14480, partial [Enterococcus faecalis]